MQSSYINRIPEESDFIYPIKIHANTAIYSFIQKQSRMKVGLIILFIALAINFEPMQSVALNPLVFMDLWKNLMEDEGPSFENLEVIDCFEIPAWSLKWYEFGCHHVQPRVIKTWRRSKM